ncbi:MAG: hypothetical protein KY476_21160 [Planctomycetes bacterium]|nr:hypothetical protein [Planctomycetota bacterium]
MRFFTPDLYLQLNARDDKTAEDTHQQWETAIVQYRIHLTRIGARLSPSTRKIAESLCLHDARYLGMSLPQLPTAENSLAIVSTRHETKLVVLIYALVEDPLIQEVERKWPCSADDVRWLYDEFDFDERGAQQHEVLLSNGRVITLRFHEMQHFNLLLPASSAVA